MSDPRVPPASRIKSAQTPAEELRETLNRLDAHVGKVKISGEGELLETLLLFDRVDYLFDELSERGADLTAERTRFTTVSQQFRRKAKDFVKRIGGPQALQSLRREREVPEARWWWYIDRYLSEERFTRWRRTLVSFGIAAVIVGAVVGLYSLFLAPDEATRERYRYQQRAENALQTGDPATALGHVDTALTYAPGDPELLLLKGAILQFLDRPEEAETFFNEARATFEDPVEFLAARAETYMRAGMPEQARVDAEQILALDEDSAVGYFLLGGANASLGNLYEANQNYERAASLASAEGNAELEGMARVQIANLMMLMMAPQSQSTATPTP